MSWKDEAELVKKILKGLGLSEVKLPQQHVDFPTNLDDTTNADLGNLLIKMGALRARQTWLIGQVQMTVQCIKVEYEQRLWAAVGYLESIAPKKRLKDAMIADALENDKELLEMHKNLKRHKILLATLVKTFDIYSGLWDTVSRAITVRGELMKGGVI